jgi:hypothetical protein
MITAFPNQLTAMVIEVAQQLAPTLLQNHFQLLRVPHSD